VRITTWFGGACVRCGEWIHGGTLVEWEPKAGVAHPDCVKELAAPKADPKDVARLAELREKREREAKTRSEGRPKKLKAKRVK